MNSYDPLKCVSTYFIGELGTDTGGMTCELWRLFAKGVEQTLFYNT